jgi:hypothetical protein
VALWALGFFRASVRARTGDCGSGSSLTKAQQPEIDGLMDINTFEFIPKIDLPPRTRYLDLIWTYRCKRCPDGSLKKYKARLCVNGSRQIQGIDYTESFAHVVQWSTIHMVNTLATMHNLKGKHNELHLS